MRFLELITVNTRDPNTRGAKSRAAGIAPYIENCGESAAPASQQNLVFIRVLFAWLVTAQVVPSTPAHAVLGPRYSVSKEANDQLLRTKKHQRSNKPGKNCHDTLSEQAYGTKEIIKRIGGEANRRLELQFRFVCRRFGFRYFFFGVGCHNSILLPSGS